MNAHSFILPIYYVQQIADQVGEMGIDVQQWLKHAGLNREQLSNNETQLDFEQLRQLILQGIAMTQEPAVGLLIGERLLVNSHGFLGMAAMSSGSLRQAMYLVERYIGLRTSMIKYHYEESAQEVRQIFNETFDLGDVRRPVLETVTLTIKNVLDFITMKSCPINYIAFPFPDPGYASLAQDMFACEVRYGQNWTGCSMPLSTLDQPIRQADPVMFQTAELICQQELEKLNLQTTLSARIRRLMLEKQNGFPSLQVTARMLNMTPRTLHRRLLDENTTFKELLEGIQHGLALKHLKSGHMSVQAVAYTLGYTDVSNFRRAFKRWTGKAPSDYLSGQ